MGKQRSKHLILLLCGVPVALLIGKYLFIGLVVMMANLYARSETRSANGIVAAKWLDAAMSHDWTQNPFPSGDINSVKGMCNTGPFGVSSYWLRVDFNPTRASQIISNIHNNLQPGKVNPLLVNSRETIGDPDFPALTPAFFVPQRLGPSQVIIEVLRRNGHGGPITTSATIYISTAKGIAYVRYWRS